MAGEIPTTPSRWRRPHAARGGGGRDRGGGPLAAFRRLLLGLLLALLALAIGGAGLVLNRRRRGAKREAEQLLADWRPPSTRSSRPCSTSWSSASPAFVGPVERRGQAPLAGETLRLAGEVRADVGSLSILWTSARSVLEKAAA